MAAWCWGGAPHRVGLVGGGGGGGVFGGGGGGGGVGGRLGRGGGALDGESSVLGPTTHRGRSPIWVGGAVKASSERVGKSLFDGWFTKQPDGQGLRAEWADVLAAAKAAGRDPSKLTAAMYLNLVGQTTTPSAPTTSSMPIEGFKGQIRSSRANGQKKLRRHARPRQRQDKIPMAEAGRHHLVCASPVIKSGSRDAERSVRSVGGGVGLGGGGGGVGGPDRSNQ